MSQKGVSFRLNSHVTAFSVLIIAAVVYINFHFSNKILIGKIEEGAINQSNLVISNISRITIGTEEIARNVSYQAAYYYKHNDIEVFLREVVKANPILESIHVDFQGDDKKIFSYCNADVHCEHRCNQSENIFSTEGNEVNRGMWSEPFFCTNDSTHLLVTYKYPIFKPDTTQVLGYVLCEISLRKMRQMLSQMTINHNGYSFIIDKLGNYLTHPCEDWILRKNVFTNPSFFPDEKEEFRANLNERKSGVFHGKSEYLNNKPAWFYFAPLASTNWIVVIAIPEADLFKEIHLIFVKIIWVCSLGILILFLLNMLIFRRILTPLAKISEAIYEFTSTPGSVNSTKDEIKTLRDSLSSWQAKYGSLMKEKTQNEFEKNRIEKELKSAREIQQNIVPKGKATFSDHPEIDLFATLMPAGKVGGDLYDYFLIDKTHLLIAIGDVSGKGIPASLFMAVASTLIKTNAKILSAKAIVAEVNRELNTRNSDQYFLTLFLGVVNLTTGVLDYCNAAHNYPYILKGNGQLHVLSKSHGLPLGIYRDKSYGSSMFELAPNDMLILFTDGVINAIDEKGQYYTTDRLEKNIRNLTDLTAEEVVNKLFNSIMIFNGDNPQSDDVSILAFKYLGKAESQE